MTGVRLLLEEMMYLPIINMDDEEEVSWELNKSLKLLLTIEDMELHKALQLLLTIKDVL